MSQTFMKFLLFLFITTLLAASPVVSQTRKAGRAKSKRPARAEKSNRTVVLTDASSDEPPLPKTTPKLASNERLSSDVFKDVTIGKWGVASLSLPDDLTYESDSEKPIVGKNTSWTTYARYWKQAAELHPSALEADLTVTTWNSDFKLIVPELRPDLATPEHFILIDLLGDIKHKNAPDSHVKEAKPMSVGGVDGGFFRADAPGNNKRFLAGWYTYRFFEGKAQRISLTITGRKDELEKALKIIESLKLK